MNLPLYALRRALVFVPSLILLTMIVFSLSWLMPHYYYILPLTYGSFVPLTSTVISNDLQAMNIFPSNPALTYLYYLKGIFTGNWGLAVGGLDVPFPFTGNVYSHIGFFLDNSLQLILASFLVSVFVAIALGSYASRHRGGAIFYVARFISYSGFSAPAIWVAPLLVMIFGRGVGIPVISVFPISGRGVTPSNYPGFMNSMGISSPTGILIVDTIYWQDWPLLASELMHMVLPITTISYGVIAGLLRFYMLGIDEEINKEYVAAARSRGIQERDIYRKHIRKTALVHTVPQVGLVTTNMILGLIVAENFFSYYGLGELLLQSFVVGAYIPMVEIWPLMATVLIFGIMVLLSSFIADLLQAYVDPRTRLS